MNQPWHNRPSVLSAWTESVAGQNLEGSLQTNLSPFVVSDGRSVPLMPIVVPRPCVITSFAFKIVHATAGGGQLVTLGIDVNTDCGTAFDNTVIATFNIDANPDLGTCACGKVSVCFDACEPFTSWRPTILVGGGGVRVFRFRINFGLDLR